MKDRSRGLNGNMVTGLFQLRTELDDRLKDQRFAAGQNDVIDAKLGHLGKDFFDRLVVPLRLP